MFHTRFKAYLDENEAILSSFDRKYKNRLFRAVQNGDFEDMEDFKPNSKSDHLNVLPVSKRLLQSARRTNPSHRTFKTNGPKIAQRKPNINAPVHLPV
jgi:hypothetical protein